MSVPPLRFTRAFRIDAVLQVNCTVPVTLALLVKTLINRFNPVSRLALRISSPMHVSVRRLLKGAVRVPFLPILEMVQYTGTVISVPLYLSVIGVLTPLSFIEIDSAANVVASSRDFPARVADVNELPWIEEVTSEPEALTICAELRVRN